MKRSGNARAVRFFTVALLCAFLVLSTLQSVLAFSVTIAPNDIQFERKSATTGSKLSWQWTSSDRVVFSISGTRDPGAVLYSAEGTADTGSINVPKDDTYVLLWFNPNNSSVDVEYSSSVEAGTGSILLPIAVLVILVALVLLALMISRRRSASDVGHGQLKGVHEMQAETEEQTPNLQPSAPYIPPLPPPPRTAQDQPQPSLLGYCPGCGQAVSPDANFCAACGSRLS